jgi:uridine phosphorylase
MAVPPLLDNKNPSAPSVFLPAALMREARRQRNIKEAKVPSVCLLDPDGDLVRHLRRTGRAKPFEGWPCYHTELDMFSLAGTDVGIVGRAVGASFAVLVAEELFATGCRLLISLTSAGQIVSSGPPPYFIIIERALRDEGTSYHYAPPSDYASACPNLLAAAVEAVKQDGPRTITGATWTTDAPFRETGEAIQAAADKGILAVEMEAAALYAFASATGSKILCLAHVTNTMARSGADFEKGEDDGTVDAMAVLGRIVGALAKG